jgi:hypothetical protein
VRGGASTTATTEALSSSYLALSRMAADPGRSRASEASKTGPRCFPVSPLVPAAPTVPVGAAVLTADIPHCSSRWRRDRHGFTRFGTAHFYP